MKKGAEAFRSIGEVAKLVGVAPHVLRYWETQFSQLKPMKRPDGRRYYRPEDVRLVAGLCEILREEGLTIRGAKKLMARDRGEAVRERGAARLDQILGVIAPADVGTEQPVEVWAATTVKAGDGALADTDFVPIEDTDPALAEEASDMPSHPPRSRHRRRRHPHDDAALPLFPDLERRADAEPVWLARMIGLSAALRTRNGQTHHPGLHAAATQLRDAILALD